MAKYLGFGFVKRYLYGFSIIFLVALVGLTIVFPRNFSSTIALAELQWRAMQSTSESIPDSLEIIDLSEASKSHWPKSLMQSLPESLQGVWWVEGHPYGLSVFTFETMKDVQPENNLVPIRFGFRRALVSDHPEGMVYFDYLNQNHLDFVLQWDPQFQFSHIDTSMDYPFDQLALPAAIFEGYLSSLGVDGNRGFDNREGEYAGVCFCSIRFKKPNLLVRENFGGDAFYFKRIIDGEGAKTDFYHSFVESGVSRLYRFTE